MTDFTIKTDLLRAASVCVSKSKIRMESITGIYINKKFVEATNGHIAIRMESGIEEALDDFIIVRFNTKFPTKAYKTTFPPRNGFHHTVTHHDKEGRFIAHQNFEQLALTHEGAIFPSFEKMSGYASTQIPKSNQQQVLSICYLSFLKKMFKKGGAMLIDRGIGRAQELRFSADICKAYGNPRFLIMPAYAQVGGEA